MRVLLGAAVCIGQPGLCQYLGDIIRAAWLSVSPQCLADLVTDLPHRIQVRHGILWDHTDRVASKFNHPALGSVRDVLAVQENLAARHFAVGGQESNCCQGSGRFA